MAPGAVPSQLLIWNAQGTLGTSTGINHLHTLIHDTAPSIVLLQETGRYDNNKNKNRLKIKNFIEYSVLPASHEHKYKNSLSTYIREDINHLLVTQTHTPWGALQTIKIMPPSNNSKGKKLSFHITNIYIRPQRDFDNAARKDLDQLFKKYTNHIICGDFNAKCNTWGKINERENQGQIREGNIQGDRRGMIVNGLIEKHLGQIANTGEATRLGNINSKDSAIDLTLIFGHNLGKYNWAVGNDPYGSDHLPTTLTLEYEIRNNYKHPPFIKFNLDDNPNFELFKKQFDTEETIPNGQGYNDLKDTDVDKWLDNIENKIKNAAIKSFKNNADKIGKIDKKPKQFRKTNYWFNDQLKAEKKSVNKKLKKFRASENEADRNIYRCAKKTYETNIKITKHAAFIDWINADKANAKVKDAFNKFQLLQNGTVNSSIGTIIDNDGVVLTNDKDKADALAKHYQHISSDNFLQADFIHHRNTAIVTPDLLDMNKTEQVFNRSIKLSEFNTQLRKRKKRSATGSDGIEYRLLYNLPVNFKIHIIEFFNYIFDNCHDVKNMPTRFRTANIITLLKPDKDPKKCASYRPISLTNHLGKILEAIMNKRLKLDLESRHIINPNQAGFRNKRECLEQVARIEAEVRNLKGDNYGVLAAFLDIEKAFDTACRPLILKLLKQHQILGQLYNYIRAFLSGRSFQVKVGSDLSESKTISNGVPQGAVLSPTLFLLTLNFLDDSFFPQAMKIKTAQFADDTCLYKVINISDLAHYKNNGQGHETNQHVIDMNRGLELAVLGIKGSGYKVNEAKTEAVLFVNSKCNTNVETYLTINNTRIDTSKSARYLGVIMDKHLTFNEHLTTRKQKSTKACNLVTILKGAGYFENNGNGAKTVIASLVESKLLYGREILPNNKEVTKSYKHLASIYKKALGLPKFTEYKTTFAFAGILPPEHRTKLLRQAFYARKCSMPESKIKDLFVQYQAFGHIPIGFNHKNKVAKFSSIKNTHIEFNKLNFDYNTIKAQNRFDIINEDHAPTINLNLSTLIKKGKTCNDTCLELFSQLRDNIDKKHDHPPLMIYTDASRKDNLETGSAEVGVGIAGFHKYIEIGCYKNKIKLNDNLSIASAEAFAIKYTLEQLIQIISGTDDPNLNKLRQNLKARKVLKGGDTIYIFSDSLSALLMINNPDFLSSRYDIILDIHNATSTLKVNHDIKIEITWIPSHVGIVGNEEADRLANEAILEADDNADIGLGYTEAKALFRKNIKKDWTAEWNAYTANNPHRQKALITNPLRKSTIAVSKKARKRNILLTNTPYFLLKDKFCNNCKCQLTVPHVLLECTLLKEKREKFIRDTCNLLPPFHRPNFKLELSHFLDPDLPEPQLKLALNFINDIKSFNI